MYMDLETSHFIIIHILSKELVERRERRSYSVVMPVTFNASRAP